MLKYVLGFKIIKSYAPLSPNHTHLLIWYFYVYIFIILTLKYILISYSILHTNSHVT
jgi:hypothetical protein